MAMLPHVTQIEDVLRALDNPAFSEADRIQHLRRAAVSLAKEVTTLMEQNKQFGERLRELEERRS